MKDVRRLALPLALLLVHLPVQTEASPLQDSPHHLVVVTGYWSLGLPAAKAASGLPVTVVVEDAVSHGFVSPDAVKEAILRADTILLVHTRSNPILGTILANLPAGKRVFVYNNVLPKPQDARNLADVTVEWEGVTIPLSLYVQSRSERNLRSLFEYLLTGRPGPFHPFDGWVEGYDYERDEIVRPEDPGPEELREALSRYGSAPVYLGDRAYPRWFVELLKSRLPDLIREVLSHEPRRDGPAVLIVCDSTALECGWTAPLRELCRALVKRGLAPLVLALHYDLLDGDLEDVLRALRETVRRLNVQAVIFLAGFFRMRSPDSPEVKLLEELGVPVVKAIRLGHTMTEWQAYWRMPSGMDWSALYHIVIPENLGLIEGIPISVREWRTDGPRTLLGGVWRADVPVPPMVELLASRVAAWVKLRLKPNAEKRVVILYWAAEPGKEGVGVASSLDVSASIVNFLAWLLARGYRVEIPRELAEYLRRFADEVPRDSELYRALKSGSIEEVVRAIRGTLLEINRLEVEAEELAEKGGWRRALELYARAYRLMRPLADALGRLMVEEGSNIGAYILRRVRAEDGRLVLELLAYENGRFVRREWEVRYVHLLPLDEYLRWYRTLPEEARLCVEKGIFGYLEALLRFVKRYGPVVDSLKLRALTNGLRSLVAYVEGHLQYLQLSDRERREFLGDLRSLVEDVVSALTDPNRVDEALHRCEELHRKWSRVEALYGWFTGWGPPERSRYLVEIDGKKYFVIRGIRFGNVLVAPQPARGYYVGISVAYHSTILPPCHYYLACYYYFTRVFRADVIVNTGKHGTYEWLPYKPLFMSWWDFPQICIQDVPQVYPYYVADPSEALVAKRRGWAVLVNYLPESLARCELEDEWGELLELLREYLSSGLSVYRARILELVKKTRAYELLNLSSLEEFERDFDGNCARLYFLLHDLEEHEVVPVGLHVFGMPPLGEDPVETLASFAAKILVNETLGALDYPRALELCREVIERPEARESDELHREAARVVELLFQSARLERENFLRALEGRYVPPGYASSPFKEIDALPTGRNSCMFDPRKWPDWISINPAYAVAIPLRLVAKKVVAFDWATDNINTRALPIAVQMLLLGVLPRRNSEGVVVGVDPCAPLRPNAVAGTRRYGQVLITGRLVRMDLLGSGTVRLVVAPPGGGTEIEVRAPLDSLPFPLFVGDHVTILGTLVPPERRVELLDAEVLRSYEGGYLTPTELAAVGSVASGPVVVKGTVKEVSGNFLVVTDGTTDVRCCVAGPVRVRPGETVFVRGRPLIQEEPPIVSATLVLRGRLTRITDVIVLGTSCFRDVFAHNILAELFLGRAAAILAAEPYLAAELGVPSLVGARVKGANVPGLVLERLREIVGRLRQGRWENPLHETVLRVYEAALDLASSMGRERLARLLWEGLKSLYAQVQEACSQQGLSFDSVLSTARELAYLAPPSENYAFLDWAAVYLALLACREREVSAPLRAWVEQVRRIPEADYPLLAAIDVFCQAPGDYTNVIGKTIESGAFLLEERVKLALTWISAMSYLYGPRYWGVSVPLLLALNLAVPDHTLHTMVSSDEKATFFYDDCIYAFEGGMRLAVEAVNGLAPEQEPEIGMLVLNLRHAALGTYTGGDYSRTVYRLAHVAELIARANPSLAPWLRDLASSLAAGNLMAAMIASNLTLLMQPSTEAELRALRGDLTAAYRYALLMPFQSYAWYDLMRTVFNPLYLRGKRFHGYSGAVDLLKRLDFLITGWSTLTPGLLGWNGIFRRVARVLVENRSWLARYAPESLLSVSVKLLVIAFDRARYGLVSGELLRSPEFVQLVREVIVPELLEGELCCCPAVCGNPTIQERFLQALAAYESIIPQVRPAIAVFTTNYVGRPIPGRTANVTTAPGAAPAPTTVGPTPASSLAPTAAPATTPAVSPAALPAPSPAPRRVLNAQAPSATTAPVSTSTSGTPATSGTRSIASTAAAPSASAPVSPMTGARTAVRVARAVAAVAEASVRAPVRSLATAVRGTGGGASISTVGAALKSVGAGSERAGGGKSGASVRAVQAGAASRGGASAPAQARARSARVMVRSSPATPASQAPRWVLYALIAALLMSVLAVSVGYSRRAGMSRTPGW